LVLRLIARSVAQGQHAGSIRPEGDAGQIAGERVAMRNGLSGHGCGILNRST